MSEWKAVHIDVLLNEKITRLFKRLKKGDKQ